MSNYQTELDMVKGYHKNKEKEAVGQESIENIGSTGKGVAQALQQSATGDGYQVPKPIEMSTD